MKNKKSLTNIFLFLGIASLLTGGVIYVLCRETTYVAVFIRKILPDLPVLKIAPLLTNYLPDYLWALSLSCGLHILFLPEKKGSIVCSLVVVSFGAVFEICQYAALIKGTGDFIDVLLYLLAGTTVNLINLKRRR